MKNRPSPKITVEVWRICPNPRSNDFNSEPENVIRPYRVYAYDADAEKYWVESDGWHGFKHRHWVDVKTCYASLEDAEQALKRGVKA